MQTVPKQDPKDKARALRDGVNASVDRLAEAVDEVRASEEFRAFLDMQAQFHDYSWHNCMLILSQCPGASHVCGFKTWNKLGRFVRKGERGIMIFAPRTFTKERENADGETETDTGIYFRPVYVFDVSQTDGEPLPEIDCPTIDVASDRLLSALSDVTRAREIRLIFAPIDGGAFGVSRKGEVQIDPNHATGQQAKTLAHELAHEALHATDRGSLTRSIAELEAESVAYVVCRHFGLDTEVRSAAYIAIWQGDSKSLKESLDRIARTARAIIDDVETVADRKAVA